jgi:hypothetical protein
MYENLAGKPLQIMNKFSYVICSFQDPFICLVSDLHKNHQGGCASKWLKMRALRLFQIFQQMKMAIDLFPFHANPGVLATHQSRTDSAGCHSSGCIADKLSQLSS